MPEAYHGEKLVDLKAQIAKRINSIFLKFLICYYFEAHRVAHRSLACHAVSASSRRVIVKPLSIVKALQLV